MNIKQLLLAAFLLLPVASQAQQLIIYCNHATAVACTTASPGTPVSAWDPPWLVGGKSDANFGQLYAMFGSGTSLQTTGVASAADLGGVLNVTGLMKGNGLAAPTAYGGSSCTGGQFPTSVNSAGVWTCGSVTGFASLSAVQTWSALQTFPASDIDITSLPVAVGTGFVCATVSTGALSYQGAATCNGYTPVSLSVIQTWTATQTFGTINATTIQQGGVPILQLPPPVQAGSTKSLVATDCMQTIALTTGNNITVNGNVLAAGCIVNFTLHSGTATITQGSSMTLGLGNGGSTTGTRTVTGIASGSINCDTATTCVVAGGGVT